MIVQHTQSQVKLRKLFLRRTVFTKHDISQVFGIPETRVTNWEVGRTIKLRPSIQEASGKGTRNIYSLCDVYKTGLAIVLLSVGIAGELVQRAVDDAPGRIELADWLFIEYVSDSTKARIRWSRKPPRLNLRLSNGLIINLANIRKAVNSAILKGGE